MYENENIFSIVDIDNIDQVQRNEHNYNNYSAEKTNIRTYKVQK